MYHVGKVLKVLRKGKEASASDNSVQAVCEMWDDNQLTLLVEDPLAEEIKEHDVVVVDYRPLAGFQPVVPKQSICKVLKGKLGEDVWKLYNAYQTRKQTEGPDSRAGKNYLR